MKFEDIGGPAARRGSGLRPARAQSPEQMVHQIKAMKAAKAAKRGADGNG